MKLSIVLIICFSLIGSALAQTLSVQTDPTGLEVWRNGEMLGISPVTIEGPFDNPVEITVKSPTGEHVWYVEIPEDKDNHVVFIRTTKDNNTGKTSLLKPILGILAGAALITALFFVWALTISL